MNNNLLMCPLCAKQGKKQILGRVMEDGNFLVLRFHHGTTIISAKEYQIKCGCGYVATVNEGAISSSMHSNV